MSTMPSAPDSTHLHAHLDGDAHYQHQSGKRSLATLSWALALTLGFAGVEAAAGFVSGSLALVSDAGHMLTDAASLALALLAQFMARRPPSERYSFGYGRAEALAAFVNGLAMLLVVAWILFEAVQRFAQPRAIQGATVMAVAAIGLLINVAVAWILSRDQGSMNTRAALVHVLGDYLFHRLDAGRPAAVGTGGTADFKIHLQHPARVLPPLDGRRAGPVGLCGGGRRHGNDHGRGVRPRFARVGHVARPARADRPRAHLRYGGVAPHPGRNPRHAAGTARHRSRDAAAGTGKLTFRKSLPENQQRLIPALAHSFRGGFPMLN
jgi:hypothetical protein